MKRRLLVIFAILCLILCLGLASCGGNGGTEDNEEYVTITFDTKGGSAIDSIQVEKGSKIPKPQDPERLGYTFDKWSVDGTEWVFIGYVATEDMTLEASWTLITYTIEYIGQVNHTNKTTYTVEDEFDLVGSDEGLYIFQGWYLDEDFTKPISKIEKGTTGNLKLYGKTKDSGLKIELNGYEYSVVGCDKNVTSVVIPETCNGLRITSIGNSAFSECTGLTSIEIPNSVTSIGDYAFYNCTGLTSIIVDEGNPSYKSIGGNLYSKDEKTLVQYAIGKKDTSFVIPSSVTAIGLGAFSGCTSLTSVTIPNSVTAIVSSAFFGCKGLTSIIINEGNPSYKSIDGNLYSKDEKTLVQYAIGKKDTSFVIPSSVTSIGDDAFEGCTGLTSVEIPNSVTSIGNFAFSGCTSLTSIVIPNSVTTISEFAFYGCTNLISVVIPNSVTTIDRYTFSGCTGLTSIEIPNSVTTIDDYAFYYCTSLTSIEIPNSVTSIGDYAFWDCTGLTSVAIPNSVTIIGASAFSDCTGLTSVTIGDSVTTIGYDAFYRCTGLTSIIVNEENPSYKSIDGNLYSKDGKTLIQYAIGKKDTSFVIPSGVTTIGSRAFKGCTGLTSVTIPNSVTTIGNDAFYNCTELTSIIVDEGNSSYKSIDGNLYSKDGKALIQYAIGKKDTSFVIPNSVTTIGSSAFYGCTGLTSVKIPNSVTSIGNYTFLGCTGLTSVVIPNSVTSIGEYVFYGCTGLTIYCEAERKPDGWDSFWNYSNCPVVWGYKEN